MADEKQRCPFEGCTSAYKKKKGVKDHLIMIIGTDGYDRFHRRDDPLWATLKEEGFLKVPFEGATLLTWEPGKSQGQSHRARKGGTTTGHTTQALLISQRRDFQQKKSTAGIDQWVCAGVPTTIPLCTNSP